MIGGSSRRKCTGNSIVKKTEVRRTGVIQFVLYAFCRNCIGQHFAMNEEKVVLSRLLHK